MVSLPLYHRSSGPPSQSMGKKPKTHLLMDRVSTSHRNKCLWDGRSHYSHHGKHNLPITNGFLDEGVRLRAVSGGGLEVEGRVKSKGKRPFHLSIYCRFLTERGVYGQDRHHQAVVDFLADPGQNLRIFVNTAHQAAMANPSEWTLQDKIHLPILF